RVSVVQSSLFHAPAPTGHYGLSLHDALPISEQRKGEGMGYFVMSVNLGIVLGPLIGLSLMEYWSYFQVSMLLIALIFIGFTFCFLIPVKEPEKIIENSN